MSDKSKLIPYLSTTQAAEILKINQKTVIEHIRKLNIGHPLFFQEPGGRWLIKNPEGIEKLKEYKQKKKAKRNKRITPYLYAEEYEQLLKKMNEAGYTNPAKFVVEVLKKNGII